MRKRRISQTPSRVPRARPGLQAPVSLVRTPLLILAFAQLASWLGLQMASTLGGPVLVGMTHAVPLAGFPLGIVFLVSAASAAIANRARRQLGGAGLLAAGATSAALGTAIAAASSQIQSPTVLLAGIALEGFGLGWCWLTRYDAAALLGTGRAKLALGLVVGAAALGAVSGPLTIPVLRQLSAAMGLRGATLPWALAAVLFALVAALAPLAYPRAHPATPAARRRPRPAPRVMPTAPAPRPLQDAALRRSIVVFGLIVGAMTAVMGIAPAVWSQGQVPGLALALVMSAHFFGMFGLAPLLVRWMEPPRTAQALLLACVLTAVSVLALIPAQTPVTRGAGMFGVGLGWSLAYLALSVRLAAVPQPRERQALQARTDLVGQLLGGIFPLAGGLVLILASFPWLLGILAAICVSALLALTGRREWRILDMPSR